MRTEVHESCQCGATITVSSAHAGIVMKAVSEWRATHRCYHRKDGGE